MADLPVSNRVWPIRRAGEENLVRRLVELVRSDPRVRTRHVRVQVKPGENILEIGGQFPPWWSVMIDLEALERDPQGQARDIVNAWVWYTPLGGA